MLCLKDKGSQTMNYEIILPEFPPLIFHPSVIHTLAPAALVQSLALFFSY